MKVSTASLIALIAASCTAAEPPQLASDPVAAVRKVLPKAWAILRVADNTYPSYRPAGNGKAIFLGIAGAKYPKQGYSAVLYLMPADYADGGDDPTRGQAQTWPAKLIATAKDAKLYLWPGPQAEDWKTMQEDLLKAVFRSSEQSAPANGASRRR